MRVVHVTSYFHPAVEWGGPVRSVAMLAQACARAGADVEVLTTNARGGPRLPRVPPGTREVGGVRVTYVEARGPARFFFSAGLRRLLDQRVPPADVVHLHGIWTYPVLAAARACERLGVPYVLSPRGSLDPWALGQKRWKKRGYLWLFERRTLEAAALLHFTSEDERRTAPDPFRSLPGIVIPNCLEVDDLLGLEREAPAPGPPEILMLGRIHPMKGFDVMVPALAALAARGVDARLVVAGGDEGGHRAEVEDLVRRHAVADRVRFLGSVEGEARRAAFRRAGVLAAPSHRENFGNAIAEAMAAGLPVVVSPRVGIASDVFEAGAGLVVPREPAPLAEALAGLLADASLRAEMGRRGRELVRTRYAAPAVARATLAAYREIARPRPAQEHPT
ncbi:MAG: glycosyltransferase [Anaeromyxobacteraceae bacterium]